MRIFWPHSVANIRATRIALALSAVQNWQVAGAGGGGSLYSPSINPTNPQEIYIASDMGQIFHTTTGGTAWSTVDFNQIYGGPDSQVQFTSTSQILYAIDYASGGDDVTPAKSSDGGAAWLPLAADPSDGGAITLVADYNNPNRCSSAITPTCGFPLTAAHIYAALHHFRSQRAASRRRVFRRQQHLCRHQPGFACFHERWHQLYRRRQHGNSQHAKNAIVRRGRPKWHGPPMGRHRHSR